LPRVQLRKNGARVVEIDLLIMAEQRAPAVDNLSEAPLQSSQIHQKEKIAWQSQ
jgi:hypothetical protein